MSEDHEGAGCTCCTATATAVTADPVLRTRFIAGAAQLGIHGADLAELAALFDAGNCAMVQRRMAQLVGQRLQIAQLRVVEQIEHTANVHGSADTGGLPPAIAGLQRAATDLTAQVARLQAAAHLLAQATTVTGPCGQGCACMNAASPVAVRIPAARIALTDISGGGGVPIVCTLDGGLDAMRSRIDQWQAVIGPVIGREPADGGVTLLYHHDPVLLVELARLAAAEYACCSFFTFTLTVGPTGTRFTVTAPPQAADVVTAVFGTATPTRPAPMSTVDRHQLRALLDSGAVILVEALPRDAYDAEHLPGAVNLPGDVTADLAAKIAPDKTATVVTYCSGAACRRSKTAAAALQQLGYTDVRLYPGGKADWADAGWPFEGSRAQAVGSDV